MNKQDISKLALMGLMTGLVITSQGHANETDSEENKNVVEGQLFAHAGCGGGGCGARAGNTKSNLNRSNSEASTYGEDQDLNSYDRSIAEEKSAVKNGNKVVKPEDFRAKLSHDARDLWDKFDDESKRNAVSVSNREGLTPDEAVKKVAKQSKKK